MKQSIHAEVISCIGRLGDTSYCALELGVEGVQTPFHMVLALPMVTCKALSGKVDPSELYNALAGAINNAGVMVEVTP